MENTNNPIIITRVFNAPLAKVWAAWSVPEEAKKWWGPVGFSCPSASIDFRERGKYLLCMHGDENGPAEFAGQDMWSTGIYKEIVPMKRIVVTDSFSDKDGNIISGAVFGMPEMPMSVQVEVDFAEEGGATTMKLTHHDIPEAMRSDCMAGWNSSFDKLEKSVS